MVYGILNAHELCDYYAFNQNPGINQRLIARKDKFHFLDDPEIQSQLISFRNDQEIHVTFFLPQVHCSSCLYLLENLHRLEPAIISSKINFTRKEVDIIFLASLISLRKIAEALAAIGYEPYISLNNLTEKNTRLK